MTQEEIVKDLRDNSSYGCYINHGNCIEMHKAAASLIESLTARAEKAEAELKEAAMPESIEAAAENMFQAFCMAPQFTRELMDSVSAFWKLWAEWRGAREGEK